MKQRKERERNLRLALKRIEIGRPQQVPVGTKISILSVAREAGIAASTIHTRYPEIADTIRAKSGRSIRSQADAKVSECRDLRASLAAAKKEAKALQAELVELASVHHATLLELARLRLGRTDGRTT